MCKEISRREKAAGDSQCHLVGRTPWSAADALVGLELLNKKAGPGGPARTKGSAPQGHWGRVSSDKVRAELGFSPGSVDEALRRAVAWFQANRYV